MSDNVLIQCQALAKCYQDGNNAVDVLKGIDLQVNEAEMLAIVGSSGSGKSTLLHLLGLLDVPSSGQLHLLGKEASTFSLSQAAKFRNENLGFIYQFHHLLKEFTAWENVAMPLMIGGVSAGQAKRSAFAMIDRVGLASRAQHKPSELSGGERQRIAIARALVNEPRLVLADEPTGNLDAHTGQQIYDLMCELNASLKTSFVVVTHDLALADRLHRSLVLHQGRIAGAEQLSQHWTSAAMERQ